MKKRNTNIIGELSYEKMKTSLENGEKYIVPIMAKIIMPIGILWNRPKWTRISQILGQYEIWVMCHSMVLGGYSAHLKVSTVDFICFNPSHLFNFNENMLPVKHVLYKSKVNIKIKKIDVFGSLEFFLSRSLSSVLPLLLSRSCSLSLVLCVMGESLLVSHGFTQWFDGWISFGIL